jgi:hypothetical protein
MRANIYLNYNSTDVRISEGEQFNLNDNAYDNVSYNVIEGMLNIYSARKIDVSRITSWNYLEDKKWYLAKMEKILPQYIEIIDVETGYFWWKKVVQEKHIKPEFKYQQYYELIEQNNEKITIKSSNFKITC